MQLIGTGYFSKVYSEDGSNMVYIKSEDPVKECMAFGRFPNSRLFPKVSFSDKPGYDYEMKYYPFQNLRYALKESEFNKYQELRTLFKGMGFDANVGYFHLIKGFRRIKNRSVKQALMGAVNALADYGSDMAFEISPRNVKVDNGRLILLDCFFMYNSIKIR